MSQVIFTQIDQLQEKINRKRPLSPHLLSQLRAYYKIGLTYTSNALEGNRLTESETKVVIEDGLTIGGKPLRDHYEAIGHAVAYEHMYTLATNATISEADIKQLHSLFYQKIDANQAGQYRQEKVFISGSEFIPPAFKNVPKLIQDLVQKLPVLKKHYHPAHYAALVHKEFVFIHPLIDGNGRVARLLMNLALIQSGYVIAVIPPILRAEYISKLEKAHRHDGDFVTFIAERVFETQKDYLRMLE